MWPSEYSFNALSRDVSKMKLLRGYTHGPGGSIFFFVLLHCSCMKCSDVNI